MTQYHRPKLYLDIDGVFLIPTDTGNYDYEWSLPKDAEAFLDWALGRFDCYWLSARASSGDRSEIERAFRVSLQLLTLPPFLSHALNQIEPATWSRDKTNGIDLDSDFFWIDDAPTENAVTVLAEHGLSDRLIIVDGNDPHGFELTGARNRIEGIQHTA